MQQNIRQYFGFFFLLAVFAAFTAMVFAGLMPTGDYVERCFALLMGGGFLAAPSPVQSAPLVEQKPGGTVTIEAERGSYSLGDALVFLVVAIVIIILLRWLIGAL